MNAKQAARVLYCDRFNREATLQNKGSFTTSGLAGRVDASWARFIIGIANVMCVCHVFPSADSVAGFIT